MRNRWIGLVGLLLALWMGAGRWLFGIGGELSWWYVPLITVGYALLQLWLVRRLRITRERGRRTSRSTIVSLVLSWLCALGFGFTVPDIVGGELVSILSHLGGAEWLEMSIGICNPLGIIAFACAVAAVAFAAADARDPRPEEDEDEDGEPRMLRHPLDPAA